MSDINKVAFTGFGKHFVTLSFVQSAGTTTGMRSHVLSGFILSCSHHWFYITAGHSIEAIKALLAKGATLECWRLSDATAGGNFQDKAIPYDFNIDDWAFIYDEHSGADCAVIPITGLVRKGLEAGGVKPLEEGSYISKDEQFDQWILYGTPSETVEYDNESVITAKSVMVAAKQCDPPQTAEHPKEQILYAKLIDESSNVVKDIDGMSGGPIFGVQHITNGFRYAVIGIQSGWLKQQRILIICPIADFARQLQECVERVHQRLIGAAKI